MRDLELVGLGAEHGHVVFRSDTGEQFRVAVDEPLRAALRPVLGPAPGGDRARSGQVETVMVGPGSAFPPALHSALRPRDIQARIRAGESPEAVAAVAEVPIERIMAYAVPVLAERAHVCQQARLSGLRRKHASGPGRPLGQAVDEHLRGSGWNPDQASWDSWRREDGRWSVTVSASRDGEPATFLFDLPGRYAFAHDDAARRLVGDEPPLSVEPEPDEPRTPARQLSEPPVAEPPPVVPKDGFGAPAQRADALPFDADPPAADVEAIARVLSAQAQGYEEPVPRKRRSRRASVPSWDEIMFGSKPQA